MSWFRATPKYKVGDLVTRAPQTPTGRRVTGRVICHYSINECWAYDFVDNNNMVYTFFQSELQTFSDANDFLKEFVSETKGIRLIKLTRRALRCVLHVSGRPQNP